MAYIVHIGKYYPPDFGGIESVTATAARAAVADGNRVTVICFSREGRSQVECTAGVCVQRHAQPVIIASQPLGWSYAVAAFREGRRADLVHVHAPNMLAAFFVVTALGSGPAVLVHWHSDTLRKGILGFLLRPLEKALLKRAERIICTSLAYAQSSDRVRPYMKKVAVVPIGIPDVPPRAAPSVLPSHISSLVAGRAIVLSVGRLVPYKGFDVLIDAAVHLPQESVVVIVGDGPLKSQLKVRIHKLNLDSKVMLLGLQDEEVLAALYQNAYLFCLPSVERAEAFGVVLLEAMAYALPIVATAISGSGVPFVNDHGTSGLNVPVGNARALAEACNSILESPDLRARFSIGARQRFTENFTERQFSAHILAEYRLATKRGLPSYVDKTA